MFDARKAAPKVVAPTITHSEPGKPASMTLLTVVGEHARFEGKFDITDSIQIECEIAGEMTVGGKLVIGEKGVVNANVHTVDAIIMGQYEGNMVATGNVEIAETGRVTGNITTDSLVISKGGFFNGNITKMNDAAGRQVVAIDEKRNDQQKQQQFASR
jgi:cytoskeletal protein CcmA (bactofilin family)